MMVRGRLSKLKTMLALIPLYATTACVSQLHVSHDHAGPFDHPAAFVRLYEVGFPLLVASAEWCPFQRGETYGFLIDEVRSGLVGNNIDRPVISYVHPGSPAFKAGLAVADEILAINTRDVINEPGATVQSWIRADTKARIQPLQLDIRRTGRRHVVHLTAVPACEFSLHILDSDQINGVSNGRQVGVTSSAMRHFSDDAELAWILAHEIAHNVLNHVSSAKFAHSLNGFVRATSNESGLIVALEQPRSLEVEADYFGAYLMARSGYDLDAVRRVWQRLQKLELQSFRARTDPSAIHPPTNERLEAFEATRLEIDEKRRRGEALVPSWSLAH